MLRKRRKSYIETPVLQDADFDNPWCRRICPCGVEHLGLVADDTSRCFDCAKPANHYASIRFSVDATGEDSRNPARVKDGTAGFNMGLPPVTTPTCPSSAPSMKTREASTVTRRAP